MGLIFKKFGWVAIAIAIVVAWFLLSQLVAAVGIAMWLIALFLRHWFIVGFLGVAVYFIYKFLKK